MANKDRLDAPLISHLGAVVNFSAGHVSRAPPWMQRVGMEWIWRIVQEPGLWRRYFLDGLYFMRHFLPGLLRYRIWRWSRRKMLQSRAVCKARLISDEEKVVISISGSCLRQTIGPLREMLARALQHSATIALDLEDVDLVDGAFLGLCLTIYDQAERAGGSLSIERADASVRRVFEWNAVEWLL